MFLLITVNSRRSRCCLSVDIVAASHFPFISVNKNHQEEEKPMKMKRISRVDSCVIVSAGMGMGMLFC
jgi:hypothetical protein